MKADQPGTPPGALPPFLARARKLLAALVGVLAQAVAVGVLPPRWQAWAAVVVALATAVGVYAVPNALPPSADAVANGASNTPLNDSPVDDVTP